MRYQIRFWIHSSNFQNDKNRIAFGFFDVEKIDREKIEEKIRKSKESKTEGAISGSWNYTDREYLPHRKDLANPELIKYFLL